VTRTESVTHRILDHFQNDAVETLGYLAARMDLSAEAPGIPFGERAELISRAEKYRYLQLAALSNL